jgi:hypothetical protein
MVNIVESSLPPQNEKNKYLSDKHLKIFSHTQLKLIDVNFFTNPINNSV